MQNPISPPWRVNIAMLIFGNSTKSWKEVEDALLNRHEVLLDLQGITLGSIIKRELPNEEYDFIVVDTKGEIRYSNTDLHKLFLMLRELLFDLYETAIHNL